MPCGGTIFHLKSIAWAGVLAEHNVLRSCRKHTGSNKIDRFTVASLHYAVRPNRHLRWVGAVDPDSSLTHVLP